MVFTVRLIVVVILLLTTCASAAQRRSHRRSIPKEDDATTISPISNDATNPPTIISRNEDGTTTPEPKPKTETSSQKYNPNDTSAAWKTKSRGNAKYFTTTTEKCAVITSTPSSNARVKSKPPPTEAAPQAANAEASSNVIAETIQLQKNNTGKKSQIEIKLPYKEEKPPESSSKVPRKPHDFVQEENRGGDTTAGPKASRNPEKPHPNFIQGDENEREQSTSSKPQNFEGESTSLEPSRKIEKPRNIEGEATTSTKPPHRKIEKPQSFEGDFTTTAGTKTPPRKPEKPHNFVQDDNEEASSKTPPRNIEEPHNESPRKPEKSQVEEDVASSKTSHKLEKPHNFVVEEETTKRNENGRSLSMDIEKFISPEFHNQNNFYTSALFPDTKKFVSYGKDFAGPVKSTSSFEVNTELTTPRNQFFDSKFQAVKDDVSESLGGIDELFRYNNQEGDGGTTKKEKEDVISNNDTKADVDYKKFRHLEASESKTRNRIHKDFVAEKGVRLDLVSNYSDTKILGDDEDGINKIPATGVGAVEYKEEGPQKLPPDMEKQESKKIVAENPNPYVTISDIILPIKKSNKTDDVPDADALTNKIETDFTKSTPQTSIDPITATVTDSEKNAVSIFKRGSTKKTEATTSPDENRKDNAVVSMIKQEQAAKTKLLVMAATSSTQASLIISPREEKDAAAAKENAIVEPSGVSNEEYVKTKRIFVSDAVGNVTQASSTVSSEYPGNNLINVIKRGSTKIAEADHEYFEGVSVEPVTMRPSKSSTAAAKEEVAAEEEEEPNEILPIAETASPKTPPPEFSHSPQSVTEMSSTAETTGAPSTMSSQTDATDEDLWVATETTEIFNVSVATMTETDEEASTISTVPYSSSATSDDDTSYYAASEGDDSTTVMYEVTTSDSTIENAAATTLDIGDEDSTTAASTSNLTENDIVKQNEIYGGESSKRVVPLLLNSSTTTETPNNGIGRDIHDNMEDDLNPDDADADDYVEATIRKVVNNNQSDILDLEGGEGEGVTKTSPSTTIHRKEVVNNQSDILDLEGEGEGVTRTSRPSTPTTNRNANNQNGISDLDGESEGVAKTSPSTTMNTPQANDQSDLEGEGEGLAKTTPPEINNTIINVLSDEDEGAETTTIDLLGLTGGAVEEDNSGKIAAIVISSVGAVCLFLLAGLLIVMRKRQKRFNYGQRCRPVSLDAYSMDNVSICNTVGRRKGVLRTSKRSYGNPAFDDPATVSHPLNFFGLSKFAGNFDDIRAEFEEIPQVTTRTNELPEGCEVKNRYANVIPLPETRVFLNYIEGYPNSDYINANYVRGAKGARHYYIACQAPMQNTIDDFWRMIWEQQTKVILMLTSLFENGIEKCADYLPPSEVLDCHRLFGDFQVTLKKREVKNKYVISNLQLKNMVSNSWREITHLWYLEWPDKGVPEEANSIIAFLIEARSYMKTGGAPDNKAKDSDANDAADPAAFELSPVVVHCSPGTGRTGAVIGCDIAIREFELSRQVDIPKIVYKIRRDRASSVQTKEQYTFIYKVINLYATKLTGGALDSI